MFRTYIKAITRRLGFDFLRYNQALFPDFRQEEIEIIRKVKPFTLTNVERLYSLIQAIRYLDEAGIPGSVVECGVWRGGSMMAAAYTLLEKQPVERQLYLFDTYEGMPPPGKWDISNSGIVAAREFDKRKKSATRADWFFASLEDVRGNMILTGYPVERMHFLKGMVEDTLPAQAPEKVALMRLDTDFYESTRHELIHLYPRLASGGVLIIDDYGSWQGSRKAVDDYLRENSLHVLLQRIDHAARLVIKP
jgi:hypothetical protein